MAESVGESLVTLIVENGEGESHVEIQRPDVPIIGACELGLIDQKGRDQPPDDHCLVGEVPKFGGDVQTSRAKVTDLLWGIAGGSVRLAGHYPFQVRSCFRNSSAASLDRSGCALRSR